MELEEVKDSTAQSRGTRLWMALRERDWNGIGYALDAGADIECRADASMTPIAWAARHGEQKSLEILIARGANVNAKSEGGWSPMAFAVLCEHKLGNGRGLACAHLLLSARGDESAIDDHGFTPYMRARDLGVASLADLLFPYEEDRLIQEVVGAGAGLGRRGPLRI